MTRLHALAPLGALYGAAVRTRLALYRRGLLKREHVGAPVISIGNITTGGTGKTPLVEWVARAVACEGRRVCVLTRGYGRRDERVRVVVSDGERLLADAREGGDEPRLLAEQLLGSASVVSDADRVAAARWAVEHLRAETFVLDDGFQHLRIARDLDIVTLDATAPWGGGHLLPRGLLREPPSGLARADCVVITRADQVSSTMQLRAELARFCAPGAVVLESRVRTSRLRPLADGGEVFSELGEPVAAFCATGNPPAFFAHLRLEGHYLTFTRAFTDHHVYTQDELDALASEGVAHGARALLTTAKDAVKLKNLYAPLPIHVVEIELEFDDEGRLLELVRDVLARGGAA